MSFLTEIFEKSREEAKGETLEQMRQNYFIEASMHGDDEAFLGDLLINQNSKESEALVAKKKRQQAVYDLLMFIELERQLTAIEDMMMNKYGASFAENLAAEYLDENAYKKLMEIEDLEERRKMIALAINKGINNGSIDPGKVYENPDNKDWLDAHAEVERGMSGLDYSHAKTSDTQKAEYTHDKLEGEDEVAAFNDAFSKSNLPNLS